MRSLYCKIAPGLLAVVLTLSGVGTSHADEALRRVQQSLRDQGFYYGSIDGTPGDETTQAIRRYQIRNGLAVTGQINDETRNSIARTGAASANTAARGSNGYTRPPSTAADAPRPSSSTPAPTTSRSVPAPAPVPPARTNDTAPDEPSYRVPPRPYTQSGPGTGRGSVNEEDDDTGAPAGPPPYRDPQGRPDGARAYPPQPGYAPQPGYDNPPPARYGTAPSPALTALFERTPYEFAPPAVQADVLRRVQVQLLRSGFYDGEPNGVPGRRTGEAIANFQEVNRLRPTARLDVSTLAVLRLLPDRRTEGPRYDSPRRPGIIFEGRIVQ